MLWIVRAKKRTRRRVEKMPATVQAAFWRLWDILEESGPTGPKSWRNYGKLKGQSDVFHCHLSSDHQWVACWKCEAAILTIEIFYAGSHQDAPY